MLITVWIWEIEPFELHDWSDGYPTLRRYYEIMCDLNDLMLVEPIRVVETDRGYKMVSSHWRVTAMRGAGIYRIPVVVEV